LIIELYFSHFQNEFLNKLWKTSFNQQILKSKKHFDFRNGSIGNFFFTGSRLFFHSTEAAIFWFSGVASIGTNSTVIPVIESHRRVHIGCQLINGEFLSGQTQISHPSTTTTTTTTSPPPPSSSSSLIVNNDIDSQVPLPSPISRVFYLNDDRQITKHKVNKAVLNKLFISDTIVYGQGSLYTSVIPSLILEGVGEIIAKKMGRKYSY